MSDTATKLCEAFVAFTEAVPASEIPVKGKVVRVERGPWVVVLNATDAPYRAQEAGGMGMEVTPGHATVWFNGWLAGDLTPFGGWVAAGEAANEDTFIAAMRSPA